MRIMYLCFCIPMSLLIWLSCSGTAYAQDSMWAQTPPLGRISWNHFACDVGDDVVRAQTDALVKTGMKSVGYTHILIEPGVTGWSQIVPDFQTTFENMDTVLAVGRRSNTLGMINSVWTDDGQILLRMSLPASAYGTVAAWQSTPVERAKFFPGYAPLPCPANTSMDVALALKHLTQAETELRKVLGTRR